MKKIFILISIGLFLIAGYFLFAPQTTDTSQPALLEFTGKIVYVQLEGGFYAIRADNGKKYVPLNLTDALKDTGLTLQDNLSVQVKAEKQEQMLGIHIWGEYIHILSLTPIKN